MESLAHKTAETAPSFLQAMKRLKGRTLGTSVAVLRDLGYSDGEIGLAFEISPQKLKKIEDSTWANRLVNSEVIDRTKEMMRKVLNLSDFRMQILSDYLAATGAVPLVIREMRAEESHRLQQLQSLGMLPKEAEKLDISSHGILEAAVLQITAQESPSKSLNISAEDQNPSLKNTAPLGIYSPPLNGETMEESDEEGEST